MEREAAILSTVEEKEREQERVRAAVAEELANARRKAEELEGQLNGARYVYGRGIEVR